jgi:AraC-like DNA-binding protein
MPTHPDMPPGWERAADRRRAEVDTAEDSESGDASSGDSSSRRLHYSETLRVEQLAALATMSVSSFHRHFRAVTSMTPIQFQKEIRLREARARLIAEPGDVAGAGFAVGYDSPSQFSREYRRMFGVPPSRDARVLRDAAVVG